MNIRHGDVLLSKIDALPEGENLEHDGSFTLALGEATFHHHTLYAKKSDITVRKVNNTFFVELKVDTPLRHQEHKEIIIPKGIWTVGFEEEYDPYSSMMKKVQD